MRLFIVVAVLALAVAASARDPNLGETILQPTGLQIVNGGGSIMAPSSNQYSDCNTCRQFNTCPTTCGQVVTQVVTTQAQPVAVALNCNTCGSACPVTCGIQQPAADPTKLTVTPIQSVSPTVIGTVACGCLSQPVCACRGSILLEEKAEEKKEEEKCGCMSAPVCGCRPTTYVAPELSNSCGCSVCPCASSIQTILTTTTTSACGCSVCPCVPQYIQPEIVDPVPCGCIALGPTACPCYTVGVQVVGCPCRGQLGCGCI